MLKNVKLGVKMIGGFLVVAAIVLVVGLFGWQGANQMNTHVDEIGLVRLPSIEHLLMAEVAMEELLVAQATLQSALFTMTERQEHMASFNQAREDLYEHWEQFKELPATAEEAQLSEQCERELADWRRANDQWAELTREFEAIDVLNPDKLLQDLQRFRGDHYALEVDTVMLIRTGRDFSGGDDHTACDFGRWLTNFSTSNQQLQQLLQEVRTPHIQFHNSVAAIRRHLNENNEEGAWEEYTNVMMPAVAETLGYFDQMVVFAEQARQRRETIEELVVGSIRQEAIVAMQTLDDLIEINEDVAAEAVQEAMANGANVQFVAIVGMFVGTILALLLGIFLTNSITRPIMKGVAFADEMAKGDFSQRLDIDQQDEIGVLARALNMIVENLQPQLREIREAADVLSSSAGEISASVTQVTSGAQESATAVSQTTATVEEVKQSSNLTNQKANSVADNAKRGMESAEAGRKGTEAMAEGMMRINDQMTSIADTIVKLGDQSQAIGEITSTVDDIAEQSNLLAVNAAVEAAKAGEHGKGFAVVAQEIKSLAEQSKQATKQVREILADIQKATGAAVMATEQGSKAVEEGTKQSLEATETAKESLSVFSESMQSAGQIAASTNEQLTGMDQVAQAMESIKEASEQNVASMTQLESAAQNLKDIGHKFVELVARYRI